MNENEGLEQDEIQDTSQDSSDSHDEIQTWEAEPVGETSGESDNETIVILLENNQTILTDIYNLLHDVSFLGMGFLATAIITIAFMREATKW